MKRIVRLWRVLLVASLPAILNCAAQTPPGGPGRLTFNFDSDWRFLKANAAGAEQPGFDDSKWRQLAVPHDWSIEGPFAETNLTEGSGAFLPSGIGWYRKSFTLPPNHAGQHAFIEFDGVMANSDVWINGRHLGRRPNGYVSFSYELTPHLNLDGRPNLLAVRTDTSEQPASRWYTGAGIYRHTRLVLTSPVHLAQWGTFVTTPRVSATQAVVRVQCTVTNQSDSPREVRVDVALLGLKGKTAGQAATKPQTIPPGQSAEFVQEITVRNPSLWNLEQPSLYQAAVKVCAGQAVLDNSTTPFGIREFKFDAATGFWLNGRNFKIKGVCLHHDGGAFGAAVPLRVWERRLELLREFGANAIRTAHNPPAPEFLDLCDRMGFLVMDEFFDCWTSGKNDYDYHRYFTDWSRIDARDTLRRDRNHPSIILYSVGNEIHDTRKTPGLAFEILQGLVDVCHKTDPTRPVTQALFRPNVSGDYTNGLADLLDVIGTNYRDRELLAAQRAKPTRKIIGTEQNHRLDTWLFCRDNPQHAGQFLWTGIDYLGEARRWPRIGFGSGLLDRIGQPRPVAFQRQSWWSGQPMVYAVRRAGPDELDPADPGYEDADLRRPQVLFNDWSPQNREPHEETVEVFSNCEEVELLLDGRSLGSKPRHPNDWTRGWSVPFSPGILKVIGRNKGRIVARQELRTAGPAAKIVLTTDRNTLTPAWDDVSQISATIVDSKGVPVPTADNRILFKITGPGVIAAVDNGDNGTDEPFQVTWRNAYQGRCAAMIKATGDAGKITVSANSPTLESGELTLKAVKP